MGAPRPAILTPLRNSYWVLPGKVLAGEHPGGSTPEATRERLKRLMDAGVECFLDLTEPGELKPYDAELPFSIEYLRKPIKDHGIPAQRVHMAEILDCLHDALLSRRCVYVHCRAGIGRTGMVIGCFLVERGLLGDAALDELNRLWQQCERSQTWGSVPETDAQVEFVRRWKARAVFDDRGQLAQPALTASDDDGPLPKEEPAPWAHLLIEPAGTPDAKATSTKPSLAPGAKGAPPIPTNSTAAKVNPTASSRRRTAASPDFAVPSRGRAGVSADPTATPPGRRHEVPLDPTAASGARAGASSELAADSGRRAGASLDQTATGTPGIVAATLAPTATTSLRPPGKAPSSLAEATAPSAGDVLTDPTVVANSSRNQPSSAAAAATSTTSVLDGGGSLDEDLDPLLNPEALAAASTLRTRFLGALLGLAIGDAVAAATQYRRPGSFAAIGDMLGGGPFDLPRGGWSDDTAMALCLADSLLEREGFDARDQVERYRRWQQDGYLSATGQCVGITASCARAIAMAHWRRQAFSGSHDPSQLDPEPLSRVAPAVLYFFANNVEAVDQATQAARTTCQAPAVLDACRALARALHAALSGQPKAAVLAEAALAAASAGAAAGAPVNAGPAGAGEVAGRRPIGQGPASTAADGEPHPGASGSARGRATRGTRSLPPRAAIASGGPTPPAATVTGGPEPRDATATGGPTFSAGIMSGAGTRRAQAASGTPAMRAGTMSGNPAARASTGGPTPRAAGATPNPGGANAPVGDAPDSRAGSSAPAALAAAVAAFGATDNFRDAILYAANLGGDSDVVAAVCGQLAGAYYGVKAIPTSWHKSLMKKELIISYADRLLAHAMLGMAG
jgi:ADP-ribosylglycohydrolase